MVEESTDNYYEIAARFYDAENATKTEDLILYSALFQETGGPVLDVGCGTGRVALHLAQEGARVVGVDNVLPMLERARRKLALLPDLCPHVTLLHGDVTALDLADRFALILFTYNGFMHLPTQAEQIAALARLRAWLLPDGLLVLDLPNPGDLFATPDDGSVILERTFVEPESGHRVMQQSVSALDRASQTMRVTWIYDEIAPDGTLRRTLAPMALRYVFPAEMDLLLRVAGLQRVRCYGDYDRSPFADGSPRMIVLAKEDAG